MINFSVRVKTLGLATVGWSHPMALEADIPFSRMASVTESSREDPKFTIYIPGSSFKGALRSSASRIAHAYGFTSCGAVRPEAIERAHGSGSACDVCRLFGYPKARYFDATHPEVRGSSPLIISDLKPLKAPETTVATKIRVEDSTLKVARGALFRVEHVLPTTEFKGEIWVLTSERELLGLLLLAMANFRLSSFGRRSIADLRVENVEELEKYLDSKWLPLLSDLKRWLWDESV